MASENPDDKKDLDPTRDGPKKPRKLYKGVYENKSTGMWYAQLSHAGKNLRLGTFKTAVEAALAYDKKAMELNRDAKTLHFPELYTDYNSSPATKSTLPTENTSASGVQISEPSGSSSANVGRGKKRKQITISQTEIDAALPYHEAKKKEFEAKKKFEAKMEERLKAMRNVPQLRTGADSLPSTTSTLPVATSSVSGVAIGSESANISSVQPAVAESAVNPGVELQQDLKNATSSGLSDADKEFVEKLLNDELLDENLEPSDKDSKSS